MVRVLREEEEEEEREEERVMEKQGENNKSMKEKIVQNVARFEPIKKSEEEEVKGANLNEKERK